MHKEENGGPKPLPEIDLHWKRKTQLEENVNQNSLHHSDHRNLEDATGPVHEIQVFRHFNGFLLVQASGREFGVAGDTKL